ncbi:erg26, C-3 sterol dehydrogenase [Cadophora gregata f. sp. sojae]|nr:erg26, C-3 sterol dehydrogenase [Cadophora gregata f. sp. sojae]
MRHNLACPSSTRHLYDHAQVIIHTASALSSAILTHEPDDAALLKKVNVDGTANLLECAKEESSVEVFIYTSSATILRRKESYMATEDATSSEVQMSISRFDPYSGTKGIADTMVLLANSREPSNEGGLRTCCLRIGGMYGAGDMTLVWQIFEALRLGQHHYQIGNGTKRADFLAVENTAHAHILAMSALLTGIANPDAPKVDGEGFFITDDNPMSYWELRRKLWVYAGYNQKVEDSKVVPASILMAVAFVLEWVYFIFSFGFKQPQLLRRRKLEWVCLNRTFDPTKAKERLGYVPKVLTDDAMKSAAEWALGYQAELGLLVEKKSL